MKKVLSLALAALLLLVAPVLAVAETYELALVTDLGTIDDRSFNQGSWEGLVKYAQENNITHKYYQPKEQSDDAYLDSIQLAVEGGAKLVVTPGYLFETPIYVAQDMYPDVNFVLVDGNPHSPDYADYRTEQNVVGIVYAEEESGFLAGYAIVKEGYTKLGYMGGMAVPAVVRYGYGFVQGAEYAAKELGIPEIIINYHYTGGFVATPEAQALAAAWYNDGIEVIFAAGGKVGNSVMAAAEAAQDKWVIGVDVDQGGESPRVITSAMKGLRESVYDAIADSYKGEFPGGEAWLLGADRLGVGLPLATSLFTKFTVADYDAVFAKLVAKEIPIVKDVTAADAKAVALTDLPLEVTKVTLVE
ncbi:MAG: BMP family ABC transporter substrate-binding protein [Oscillospiraceae bacterium]|jgi:basic membrane protein A|nr:BMP family ABC transporter substrate-binding protein [Oscillospiraceae bacterium]